ncbi:MAG: sodium:solute symporter family protein [Verrucomicrobia bacterium]|nr:sodium:solute symporter family protein [Verrucomicrobiota bacterium]MCF7707463.1 sodium:solute symporter family protein [Verrucomicrobiota bacterium]
MSDRLILYSIVAGYFALILFIGFRFAAKIKDSDDFLVAGRRFGWFLILATTSATLIGGGASMGAISRSYEWGILMAAVSTGWYLQLIFSGFFVAPQFRGMRVYTVAGFLGCRFKDNVKWLAAVLSLIFSVGLLAAQMVAFGNVVLQLMPPLEFVSENTMYLIALGIGALTVIVYNLAGGLYAVVWTDLIQFLILFIGFSITAVMCGIKLQGHGFENVPEYFFNITSNKGMLFVIGTFIAFATGEMFAPAYVTRFCAGKDRKNIRWGIAGSGLLLLLIMPFLIFTIALSARVLLRDSLDPQMALPAVIRELHNPWVSGIILGALISAVMSSGDSILNSGTNIVVKDFIEPLGLHEKFQAGSKPMLRLSRYVCLGLGGLAVLIAYLIPNILDILLISYSLWAPAIVIPCLSATFPSIRLSSTKIFAVMLVGIAGALFARFAISKDAFDPGAFGLVMAAIAFLLLWTYTKLAGGESVPVAEAKSDEEMEFASR